MAGDGPFFIIGVARSGTTLLRQMLRGHPRLAIPRESHFVPRVLGLKSAEEALEAILASRHFATWDLDAKAVRERAAAAPPTPAGMLRAAYEAYAAAEGKPRWGDKTPAYVLHMDLLASAFPDAVFVHLVRDGREVAESLRERPWGPDDLLLAARFWRIGVKAASDAGRRLGSRYLEARYERLVAEPADELARICRFLGEDPVSTLLDYSGRATSEHQTLPPLHRHLLEPPTPGLRNWRDRWPPAGTEMVEAVIGPTLEQFGYPLAMPPPSRRKRLAAEVDLLRRRLAARRHHRAKAGAEAG